MNSCIVAGWDGSHIWLQWESPSLETKYELQIRFRNKEPGSKWQDWLPTIYPARNWIVIPVMRPIGALVQAQIRVSGSEENWEAVMEGKFVRSVCRFSFSSTKKPLHLPKAVRLHCHVDGAVCTYRLKDAIEVNAGESQEVELEAEASDGFSQLDKAGDFVLRPFFGVTITNTEPSRNDFELTGKDFSRIEIAKRDGSFGIAIIPREDLR